VNIRSILIVLALLGNTSYKLQSAERVVLADDLFNATATVITTILTPGKVPAHINQLDWLAKQIDFAKSGCLTQCQYGEQRGVLQNFTLLTHALALASTQSCTPITPDVIALLVEQGADPNQPGLTAFNARIFPLDYAVRIVNPEERKKVVKTLYDRGARAHTTSDLAVFKTGLANTKFEQLRYIPCMRHAILDSRPQQLVSREKFLTYVPNR
jgi:hypothetical protein